MVVDARIKALGITQEMVDQSVVENANKLAAQGKMQRFESLLWDATPAAINCNGSVKDRHNRVITIVAEASSIMSEVVPCKDGCSKCCYQAVGITSYEAKLIEEHTGVKAAPVKTNITNMMHGPAKFKGVVCPFLEDNRCSIYEVRPISCRTHFNLSKFPQLCDFDLNSEGQIPSPNFTPVWNGMSELHSQSEFGDLRDFFPHGRKKSE